MSTSNVHFFTLPDAPSPLELAARISRLDDDIGRRVTRLCFRGSEAFAVALQTVEAEDARKDALLRAGERPILLTYFDTTSKTHRACRLTGSGVTFIPSGDIPSLRQEELAQVVRTNSDFCFLNATNAYHLQAPSGMHCTRFLRVADAFRSAESLHTVAFWLAEIVAQSETVLVDTYGIASPVLLASKYANFSPRLEILPGYPAVFQRETLDLLGYLLGEISPGGKLTVLVSVNSTGNLIASLQGAIARLEVEKPDIEYVTLYEFEDAVTRGTTLCKLDVPAENRASDSCQECHDGTSTAIPIDSWVYSYRDRHEERASVKAHRFAGPREFVNRWRHVESAFRVHRYDRNDQRHHAFDIDVGILLQDTQFRNNLQAAIDGLACPPSVVIAPDHSAGRTMAELAANRWGARIIIHNDLRSAPILAEDDRDALASAGELLIIDDVLNTGTRLDGYNLALREDYGKFRHVSFLVAIARTGSEEDWQLHEKRLTKKHPWTAELIAVDKIFLPQWREDSCPWCREYELLSRLSRTFARPPVWLTERIWSLTQRHEGLDKPFLLLPGDHEELRTGAGAVPGADLPPILAIFSIASALQILRSAEPTARLTYSGLRPRLLDDEVLLLYSEGLLGAGFLRAADPREWSSARCEKIRELLRTEVKNRHVLRGEMLLLGVRRPDLKLDRQEFDIVFREPLGDAHEKFRELLYAGAQNPHRADLRAAVSAIDKPADDDSMVSALLRLGRSLLATFHPPR